MHIPSSMIEGAICPVTAGFVAITATETSKVNFRKAVSIPLVIAIFCGLLLSPFASDQPDGLEWVAQQHNLTME